MPRVRGARLCRTVFFLTACAGIPGREAFARQPAGSTCPLGQLPGLSAQYARAARAGDSSSDASGELSPAGAADFWAVAASVLDLGERRRRRDVPSRGLDTAVGLPSLSQLPCDTAVRARDRLAWSMGLVGYSAREITDVVDGHLTRAALDQALARTMAGEPRQHVAAFLESQWRETSRPSLAAAPLAACANGQTSPRSVVDDLTVAIDELARQHQISPALVRAVIAAESNGQPCAVSRAGAIGLMQLMPATAAALGVDPWQPLENLRGGITYLASMLRAYGEDTRLALIAYNAGPQHADRIKAGQAVAYRETRQYLDAVAVRYPFP